MSKIICEKIELRNFLSYGNQWTILELKEGINAVIGYDDDKDRSNGSGKTSILSAIEFVLFGQTSKEVSLNKLINWKNGKNCEVKFHFSKDGISYIIHRGIKPSILSLTKDGVDQPLLADKRFFQKELEQDLIGMDFRTAQMMTFQNANNMISLFNAKKDEKRRFIEKFFNLEIYTKMNELVNKKLSTLNDKLSGVNKDIEYKQSKIDDLQREISNTTTVDLSDYEKKLEELNISLQSVDVKSIEKDIDELNTQLKGILGVKLEYDNVISKRKERYIQIKEELSSVNANIASISKRIEQIGDLTEQRSLYERVKQALDKMSGLEEEYEECKSKDDNISSVINLIISDMKPILNDIKRLENDIIKWNTTSTIDSAECPTCFQQVNPEHIKHHIERKINEITFEIKDLHIQYDKFSDKSQKLIIERDEWRAKHFSLKDKLDKKNQLEKKLISLLTINDKEKELQELIDQLDSFNLKHTLLSTRKEALETELKDESTKLVELSENEQNIRSDIARLSDCIALHNKKKFEYETILSNYNAQKDMVDKIEAEYQVKVASKSQLEKEIQELRGSMVKSNTLKDYLTYIKETLKDDNTKQYAISNIIPYLTQRTNHYLSETGHNYYIKLDNWLDGEILGGTGDCDFGNMSGGEGKTIDLSLKFSFIDVARRQAGSYLDIMVLDEILDSSIDSFGLDSLMNIIKAKQQEDNLKVYIVSHREEISEYGFDNIIQINKKNGFSNLKEI